MSERQSSQRASSKPARSKQARSKHPWSVPVAIEDIPETGRRLEIAADAPTREAVARLAGVAGLPRLQASFDLTRHGRDGLRAVGSVSAVVDQTCIVTLEPIQSAIEEPIDLVFTPQPEGAAADADQQAALPIDAAEPPEPLHGGMVDFGAIATEFLLLGIDPYPRKPDAVFDAPPAGDPGAGPFAALAALKKRQPDGDR
jgi:hypothetical protein